MRESVEKREKALPDTEAQASGSALLDALCTGIAGAAHRVLIGFNWTYVEGPRGVGLSHTPPRSSAGCRSLDDAGRFAGRPLAELAELARSDNPLERGLGFAAINAHHNRTDLPMDERNGLDLIDPDQPSVIVGHFPGIEERLPAAQTVEREPEPGDHPESAAAVLLPVATQIAITSSAIPNGSLDSLLALANRDAFCVLIGPSTPLCPALFALGVDALSGLVITDHEGARRAIAEGGAVRALRPYARMVTLTP